MDCKGHKAWLSIGSNHSGAYIFLSKAADMLQANLSGWEMCEPYHTRAINGKEPDYLNAVACGYWTGDSVSLNLLCKEIENALGRTHSSNSDLHIVEIDIDLVCFDEEILRPADFAREYFSLGFNHLKENS